MLRLCACGLAADVQLNVLVLGVGAVDAVPLYEKPLGVEEYV